MRRSTYILQLVGNLMVGITGLVYAWMRHLLTPAEPWDLVSHPWQPHVQHLHVLAAPILVFAVGVVWSEHATPRLWRGWPRQNTSIGLLVAFVPMAASGYLLQVSTGELWRSIFGWLHLTAGLIWLLSFVAHLRPRPPGR